MLAAGPGNPTPYRVNALRCEFVSCAAWRTSAVVFPNLSNFFGGLHLRACSKQPIDRRVVSLKATRVIRQPRRLCKRKRSKQRDRHQHLTPHITAGSCYRPFIHCGTNRGRVTHAPVSVSDQAWSTSYQHGDKTRTALDMPRMRNAYFYSSPRESATLQDSI